MEGKSFESTENGLQRTYGRGAGERTYQRIPLLKKRRRTASMIYDRNHGKYPQSGAYRGTNPKGENIPKCGGEE